MHRVGKIAGGSYSALTVIHWAFFSFVLEHVLTSVFASLGGELNPALCEGAAL
jgi:hypothetical protein